MSFLIDHQNTQSRPNTSRKWPTLSFFKGTTRGNSLEACVRLGTRWIHGWLILAKKGIPISKNKGLPVRFAAQKRWYRTKALV
jgi:hypothetical protein